MVLLSARDSKRLWSHGGETIAQQGRPQGQHLESPVPTRSPWAGVLGRAMEIEMSRGSWENSSIHSSPTSTVAGSDGGCPRLNPLSHISEVLNHSSNA